MLTKEMVREAQRNGITVLSIGISNINQSDMYDEFIPYSGPEVTTRLVQWLRRKFAHIADGATFYPVVCRYSVTESL